MTSELQLTIVDKRNKVNDPIGARRLNANADRMYTWIYNMCEYTYVHTIADKYMHNAYIQTENKLNDIRLMFRTNQAQIPCHP